MEILLIRHGKAEERREGLSDLKRHLTDKGKKKFRKLMPAFQQKLEPMEKQEIILWSSPANRALGTAAIVADALSIEVDAVHDFIYEGNFDALQVAIKEVPEEATLFIVDHEPTLSEWTNRITGKQLEIKKGEIVCIQVNQPSPLEGQLEWTITP